MKEKIIQLLAQNARIDTKEIAARLNMTDEAVCSCIAELEKNDVIKGYKAIINENIYHSDIVRALIEVRVTPQRDGGFDTVARRIAKFPEVIDLSLVSGGYDLLLEVKGRSLQEVAMFVSGKLSTIEGVLSTSTAFTLKKYKESGRIMDDDEEYTRLQVCP